MGTPGQNFDPGLFFCQSMSKFAAELHCTTLHTETIIEIFVPGFWEKMENRSEASFFVTVQEEKYGRTFDCDCG